MEGVGMLQKLFHIILFRAEIGKELVRVLAETAEGY